MFNPGVSRHESGHSSLTRIDGPVPEPRHLLEEPVMNKRIAAAVSAPTPVLDYRRGSVSEKSLPWTSMSQELIKHVIGLLEAADRQLDLRGAAHGAVVQATSLLRKQITPQVLEAPGGGRGQLLFWQARKVLTYIDSHITDRVLVADLSALVRCGKSHFSRLFKRTFGESPYAFVVQRRVELAARQMLDTEIPLSDVALSCGFRDQAHLTNHFRHRMRYTPSAWRRAHKIQQSPIGHSEDLRAIV
jgi:AraC family transcriptional regulator